MKVKVILASVRKGRKGEQFAHWVMDEVKSIPDTEFELLDLKKYKLPYLEDETTPSMQHQPYTPLIRQKWAEKIEEADAFIIITPEYNRSFPASIKSALDAIYHEWNNKPVGFISYGSSAQGARAVEQLRLVSVELQMAPIRESLHFGIFEKEPVFEDGKMVKQSNNKKLHKMIKQLLWWADALRTARLKT